MPATQTARCMTRAHSRSRNKIAALFGFFFFWYRLELEAAQNTEIIRPVGDAHTTRSREFHENTQT